MRESLALGHGVWAAAALVVLVVAVLVAGRRELRDQGLVAADLVADQHVDAADQPGPGASGDRRCAACHTGGGLIMKELDTPWVHWEGHMDTPGAAELVNAGVMLAGEGLHPSSKGARVHFSGAKRSVTSGSRSWARAGAAIRQSAAAATEARLDMEEFSVQDPGGERRALRPASLRSEMRVADVSSSLRACRPAATGTARC